MDQAVDLDLDHSLRLRVGQRLSGLADIVRGRVEGVRILVIVHRVLLVGARTENALLVRRVHQMRLIHMLLNAVQRFVGLATRAGERRLVGLAVREKIANVEVGNHLAFRVGRLKNQ